MISKKAIEELEEGVAERLAINDGIINDIARKKGYVECPDCGCVLRIYKINGEYSVAHIRHKT